MVVEFTAREVLVDGELRGAGYRFSGGQDSRGWRVDREGERVLSIGQGYELYRSRLCGVNAIQSAQRLRSYFRQLVTGREVVALDSSGVSRVIEMNDSHYARGLRDECLYCDNGLSTHCPSRLMPAIERLPGGFGEYFLAPVNSTIEVAPGVPLEAAVMTEPLAAALHAATTLAPAAGTVMGVLGPQRQSLLVIAALAWYRRQSRRNFRIVAFAPRSAAAARCLEFGADAVEPVSEQARDRADIVIDTSGTLSGLKSAIRLARREVRLTSTPAATPAGLGNLDAAVRDELTIEPFPAAAAALPSKSLFAGRPPSVVWLSRLKHPSWLRPSYAGRSAVEAFRALRIAVAPCSRPDAVVVDDPETLDSVLQPSGQGNLGLVRPRGFIYLTAAAAGMGSTVFDAIRGRGLRLTASRGGSFAAAMRMLTDSTAQAAVLSMITHRFSAANLDSALEAAASGACLKAVVEYGVGV